MKEGKQSGSFKKPRRSAAKPELLGFCLVNNGADRFVGVLGQGAERFLRRANGDFRNLAAVGNGVVKAVLDEIRVRADRFLGRFGRGKCGISADGARESLLRQSADVARNFFDALPQRGARFGYGVDIVRNRGVNVFECFRDTSGYFIETVGGRGHDKTPDEDYYEKAKGDEKWRVVSYNPTLINACKLWLTSSQLILAFTPCWGFL